MKVTVDTSALLAVILDEPERTEIVSLTKGCTLVAPSVLPYELGNALVALSKRRVLTASDVGKAWLLFERAPVELRDIDIGLALQIATRHNIYAYDAYQIQCAIESSSTLLTLDRRLGTVAGHEGVKLRQESRA